MIKNLGLRFACVNFLSSEVVILLEFGFLLKIDGSECELQTVSLCGVAQCGAFILIFIFSRQWWQPIGL